MRWTRRRPPGSVPDVADELSITSGPDSTIVSLYMRLE
jgi:hypothetical protein